MKVNYENSYYIGTGVFDYLSDPVKLVFSIPLNHRHFFFTITEAHSDVFKEELTLLQHYSECVSNLCIVHSIPSDSQVLNERGYAGCVLFNPDTFHKIFNEPIVIEYSSIKSIGVVPATQLELELKREKGTNVFYVLVRPEFSRHFIASQKTSAQKRQARHDHCECADVLDYRTFQCN